VFGGAGLAPNLVAGKSSIKYQPINHLPMVSGSGLKILFT